MHIEMLRMDRFGAYCHLQIESLADGLNVFYGPSGSGKSTLVQFLNAMLYGFQADIRRRYLPAESRGFGGAIGVATPSGRITISRYDDGSTEGRLTVQYPDGRLIGHRDLLSSTLVHLLDDSVRSPKGQTSPRSMVFRAAGLV